MPDVKLEKQVPLDLRDIKTPARTTPSDMPVVAPGAAPAEEAVVEEPAPSEEPAPAADDKPKKAQGVQKRIDELTRQREDERRRAEAAEARELRILTALERATGTPKETKPNTEDVEPLRPKKT